MAYKTAYDDMSNQLYTKKLEPKSNINQVFTKVNNYNDYDDYGSSGGYNAINYTKSFNKANSAYFDTVKKYNTLGGNYNSLVKENGKNLLEKSNLMHTNQGLVDTNKNLNFQKNDYKQKLYEHDNYGYNGTDATKDELSNSKGILSKYGVADYNVSHSGSGLSSKKNTGLGFKPYTGRHC